MLILALLLALAPSSRAGVARAGPARSGAVPALGPAEVSAALAPIAALPALSGTPLAEALQLAAAHPQALSPAAVENLAELLSLPELQALAPAPALLHAQEPVTLPGDPSLPREAAGTGGTASETPNPAALDAPALGRLKAVNALLEAASPARFTDAAELSSWMSAAWDREARAPSSPRGWQLPVPWLGPDSGYLPDWLLRKWVESSGVSVRLEETPWLQGPSGDVAGIGTGFFDDLAAREGLVVEDRGVPALLPSFGALAGPSFSPEKVHPRIARFYERTSEFAFDVHPQWSWPFRFFARLLAAAFTRRIGQMNLPVSPSDTSRGIESDIFQLVDPETREVRHTAWVRRLVGPDRAFLVADYSLARIPGLDGPAAKVVFPIPGGRIVILLRAVNEADGSLSLVSSGRRLGEPGFYLVFPYSKGRAHVAYVRAFKEYFHVFPGLDYFLETDHLIRFYNWLMLRLHYNITPKA